MNIYNNKKDCTHKIIILLLFFFYSLLQVASIFADEGDSVLQFLKISPAPEASALGNAYVSVPGNANSLYYNPSLTSFFYLKPKTFLYTPDTYSLYAKHQVPLLRAVNISLSYAKYYQSLNYGSLFSTFLLRKVGTIGIGIISLFYDDITRTGIDEYGNYTISDNKINVGDYCLIINYAYKINKRIGVGINLKGIMEKLDDSTGSSFGADVGALYKRHRWGIGIAIQNIGLPVKFDKEKFNLPLDFDIGGHYILKERKFLIDPRDKILITGSVKKGIETEFIIGVGIEYSWREIIFARTGYQIFGNDQGIKAGAGIKYKNMRLDYGISFHRNLSIVHRIGFSASIENKKRIPVPDTKGDLLKKSKRGLEVGIQSDILFEYDKAELKYEAYEILNRVAREIKERPDYDVRIEGNTDSTGSEQYNFKLSRKRAESVYEYLMRTGIKKERMIAVGLGEYNPIASNDIETGRQMNRRVDIVLLKRKEEKLIGDLIRELPKAECEKVERLFYFGLDKYYKEYPKGAIEMWKQIKTKNRKLQKLIKKKIRKTEEEIKNKIFK